MNRERPDTHAAQHWQARLRAGAARINDRQRPAKWPEPAQSLKRYQAQAAHFAWHGPAILLVLFAASIVWRFRALPFAGAAPGRSLPAKAGGEMLALEHVRSWLRLEPLMLAGLFLVVFAIVAIGMLSWVSTLFQGAAETPDAPLEGRHEHFPHEPH